MQPRVLTDPFIRSLRPAPNGQRYAVSDALVPGLKVRITDKGGKTFILWRRLRRGDKSATARALGKVGELTLAEARTKAREWIAEIAAGRDPRDAERTTRDNTFAVVMDDYLARHVRGRLRKAKDIEREMRTELLSRWEHKPLTTISRRDIIKMVDEIKDRGAIYQSHNMLSHCKVFFGWAVERGLLEHSPADHISRVRLIGIRKPRQRVLSDDELRAFWAATGQMAYPFGPAFRMLLLTGCRRNEVLCARWSEFDLPARLWTIPAERFKSDATHLVPLSPPVMELLAELPRWAGTDHLFSYNGRTQTQNFSSGKAQLDELMGDVPAWVTHDLRRTVRTRLAALRIPDNIGEMIIGHGKRGLQRVYDQHSYVDEMRAAFAAWAQRLQAIVAPPPANVVSWRAA